MNVETIKMSSKGQIVIPRQFREALNAGEGSVFAATTTKGAIVLKKVNLPTNKELIEELREIAKTGKARLKKQGITEEKLKEYD